MSDHQIVKLDGVLVTRTERIDRGYDWIELGYEEGSVEFTIIQVTLGGDYRIDRAKLGRMFEAMLKELETR